MDSARFFAVAAFGVFARLFAVAAFIRLGLRGGRLAFCAGRFAFDVAFAIVFLVEPLRDALADRLDGHHPLFVADAHELDALGVAARLTDALDRRADGLSAIGD